MRTHRPTVLIAALALAVLVALPAAAQDGKLKIRVTPKQAYVFVDGKAIGDGNRTLSLSAGTHQVGVYNYGYKPDVQSVSITAGKVTEHSVTLSAVGAAVSGPWGRIQIEGAPRAAVLLNGKTPDFLVGHADEFNHDWLWKQELIVPPGTHQVTLVRDGNEIWSGSVTVAANQRVIIDAGKGGSQRTTNWPRGGQLGSVPRFKTGIASATVAVAPGVVSTFTAVPPQINCGDSSRLTWQTTGASEVWLDNNKVAATGEELVSPRTTTTYNLTAAAVGGRDSKSVTVTVNTAITASLTLAPGAQVRYRRIGDKVVEHGTWQLSWSTANADSVSITPFGSVPTSGSRMVQPTPQQTGLGAVNESALYTLTASNVCGGRETRTATLKMTGSIESAPEVILASIFYPTDYPDPRNPNLGLLRSQRRALAQLAAGFKKYLEVDPSGRLLLEAHADERRSREYNRALSERRAALVKQFLVDAGIPSGQIEMVGYGKDQNLERSAVAELEMGNPNQPPRARVSNRRGDWLAHNRRVDIVLKPSGKRSLRYYPHNADDAGILWQIPKPAKRVVEKNQ